MNDLLFSSIELAYAADAVVACERDATQEFMSLVSCEADEVRDIPADRYDVDHRKFGNNEPPPPRPKLDKSKQARAERRAAKLAAYDQSVWPWGKHQGQLWKNIPQSYLRWFAALDDPYGKHGRHLRHQVQEYLRWKYD